MGFNLPAHVPRAREGISPLDVMLKRMRYYSSVVDRELKKGEEADRGIIDGAFRAANEAAKDAAPYIHPRAHPERPRRTNRRCADAGGT